jgi:hypothetical protein
VITAAPYGVFYRAVERVAEKMPLSRGGVQQVSPRRTITPIESLDAHPNAAEIRGILSQLPCVDDATLPLLADAWHNTTLLAEARRRALEPDSPLVIETLACFETAQALFVDELHGDEEYVTVAPEIAVGALKVIRDAIAAAFARPILTAAEHEALTRAWRSVYPSDLVVSPDLGSRADEVELLVNAAARLANRCHDGEAAAEFATVLLAGTGVDEDIRCAARDEAWHAAVLTSKRRIWHLLRRSRADALTGYCRTCRQRRRDDDAIRVLTLCVDAACGLLVAAALEDDIVDVLTAPVACLMPVHRPAADA